MKKIAILGLVSFALVGCGKDEVIQTIDYYADNPEVLKQVMDDCEVGKITGLNCENARKGKAEILKRKVMGKNKNKEDKS